MISDDKDDWEARIEMERHEAEEPDHAAALDKFLDRLESRNYYLYAKTIFYGREIAKLMRKFDVEDPILKNLLAAPTHLLKATTQGKKS